MIRIGLLTIFRAYNYGAVLQAFALYSMLKDLGADVWMVNYEPKKLREHTKRGLYNPQKSLAGNVKHFVKYYLFGYERRKERTFRGFVRDKFKLTPLCDSSLNAIVEDFDSLVIGSDQVWNPDYTGGKLDDGFLLRDVASCVKKYSYASSAGSVVFNRADGALLHCALSKFDAVSVREDLLRTQLIRFGVGNVKTVVDPTMLVPSNFWVSCSAEYDSICPQSPYLLVYSFDNNLECFKTAKEVADLLNLIIVSINFKFGGCKVADVNISNASPLEFVALFKNCSYVVTNSFHGTCFSLIFTKEFFCINKRNNPARIQNLLEKYDLGSRLIFSHDSVIPENLHFSYANSQKKIMASREESLNFIKIRFSQMKSNRIIWPFVIFMLVFLNFFRPYGIDDNFWKSAYYFCIFLSVIQTLLKWNYIKERGFLFLLYSFFLIELLLSTLGSVFFQDQSWKVSLITSLGFVVYSFYFFLQCKNYNVKSLERSMNVLSLFFAFCFVVAFLVYPVQIFRGYGISDEILTDRGLQRIRLTIMGGAPIYFTFFYAISKVKQSVSKKWMLILIACFCLVVLQLGRMSIALTFALGTFYYLSNRKWYYKVFVIAFFFFSISNYAIKIPVINQLVVYSQEHEGDSDEDNVRVLSFEYYTTKYSERLGSKLIGNGMYSIGNSDYGNSVNYARSLGLIPADVGYAFIFLIFGFVGLGLYACLLLYCLWVKIPMQYVYLKYYLVFLYLSNVSGNTLLGCIPYICVVSYIIDKVRTKI